MLWFGPTAVIAIVGLAALHVSTSLYLDVGTFPFYAIAGTLLLLLDVVRVTRRTYGAVSAWSLARHEELVAMSSERADFDGADIAAACRRPTRRACACPWQSSLPPQGH